MILKTKEIKACYKRYKQKKVAFCVPQSFLKVIYLVWFSLANKLLSSMCLVIFTGATK